MCRFKKTCEGRCCSCVDEFRQSRELGSEKTKQTRKDGNNDGEVRWRNACCWCFNNKNVNLLITAECNSLQGQTQNIFGSKIAEFNRWRCRTKLNRSGTKGFSLKSANSLPPLHPCLPFLFLLLGVLLRLLELRLHIQPYSVSILDLCIMSLNPHFSCEDVKRMPDDVVHQKRLRVSHFYSTPLWCFFNFFYQSFISHTNVCVVL